MTNPHPSPSPGGRGATKTWGAAAAVVALVLAVPAFADGDVLTLEEAITIAEAQNQELAAAGARVDAAAATLEEARSKRLPRLDLAGDVQRTTNPVYVFGNLLRQEAFGPENFAISSLNQPDAFDNWNLRVEVQQPLWTGGALAKGREAASLGHDAAQAARERTRQEIVRRVTEGYATAILARHQLDVAREALETARAHVKLTRDLYEGGLVVESDLLLAQVRESEVREVVIRAESGVEVSRAALNLALGRDLDTPFELPGTLALPEPTDVEITQLVDRALASRPDLEAARQKAAAAETQVALARSSRRPQVGLQGTWETNAEDFFGHDGDNYSVAVGLRVPLFHGGGDRARIETARARAREAAEMAGLLQESIGLEVRQAFHELRAAHQRVEQAARGAELAERSLVIVEDRYKEGLDTLTELLDAETARTEARLRQVTAERDVLLARSVLDLATGQL